MPAYKGRGKREKAETSPLYAKVSPDTKAALDAGAQALNISLAAYLDLFVMRAVSDSGLPDWVHEHLDQEQLPLKFSA